MRIDWHLPSPLVLNALDVALILLVVVLSVMVLLLARRASNATRAAKATEKQEGQAQDGQAQEEQDSQASAVAKDDVNDPAQAPARPEANTSLRDLSPDAAMQVLSLLQQEARLIDFLSEDLTGHGDADIGAVARVVHEGGRRVLENYFVLSPIRTEEEESQVEVPSGFDAQAIRLTGNVTGQPPYKGILTHRGWRVSEVKLPKLSEGHEAAIIAPAEVEV